MADPGTALKRTAAGSYRSADGRFTVEQASGRWLVLDSEQHDDLGMPLVRGPFGSLAESRAAIDAARQGPAPESDLPGRIAGIAKGEGRPGGRGARSGSRPQPGRAATPAAQRAKAEPEPQAPPEIRRYRPGDGAALRAFWETLDFHSLGDDDDGLDLLAQRNPGLVLVAEAGGRVVGTALGAWDGRRGWLYHVGVAVDHRRAGLGRRLVHELERRLRALGCVKVNVIVRDDNPRAARFWEAMGYVSPLARQYGKEL
jgi:GNAT superfamily N-acetyltransferase